VLSQPAKPGKSGIQPVPGAALINSSGRIQESRTQERSFYARIALMLK
jgi:hypothetical protein